MWVIKCIILQHNFANTKVFLQKPTVITSATDNTKLESLITKPNVVERFLDIYPDTKAGIPSTFALGVKVYPVTYVVCAPISLPRQILTHNFIASLQNVPNNLCFFAACSTALGARYNRYVTKAKEFFKMFYGPDKSKPEVIKNFKGFDYYATELDAFKEKFMHAIEIVDYKADKSIELIRRSLLIGKVFI
jgi:hypothetical protein